MEVPANAPKLAIFVPGERHVEQFHDDNYESFREASANRGAVNRAVVKISQHLCAPVLNPDMRINCIAPLNHASRHLPPELRDFQLVMHDIDFSFLKTTSTPVLGDIVLSEFNGGIQTVAAAVSPLPAELYRVHVKGPGRPVVFGGLHDGQGRARVHVRVLPGL